MSCNALFDDVLSGTTALYDLTPDQLLNMWACLSQDKQRLLLAYLVSQDADGGSPGGEATITSGTGNTIPAGANSVLVTKTNSGDSTGLVGQTLTIQESSISLSAPPGKSLPEITIVPVGASTHAWTAIT